jgi:hypothetical protein
VALSPSDLQRLLGSLRAADRIELVRNIAERVPQLVCRKVVEQAGEDSAVGFGERRLPDLALQDQQLVP